MVNTEISNRSGVRRIVMVGLAISLLLVAALPTLANDYIVQFAFKVLLFILLAMGLNILSGFTGYVNFGYAGFVGIGAYLTVLAIVDLGVWWPMALTLAFIGSAIIGGVVAIPALRLRGAYFSIALLSFAVAAQLSASTQYLSSVTRGAQGISFFPELGFPELYYVAAVLMIAAVYATYRIADSPFGLRLLAIREDEVLAASLGVKTTREKTIAMMLHSGIAGVGGGLLAFNLSYIDPGTVFAFDYTIIPLVIILLGSFGSVVGPILGGVFLITIDEILWASFPNVYLVLYGVIIMVTVLFLPNGIIEWSKSKGYLPRERWI
jgi:branched-chain amino acid transport system permease protein